MSFVQTEKNQPFLCVCAEPSLTLEKDPFPVYFCSRLLVGQWLSWLLRYFGNRQTHTQSKKPSPTKLGPGLIKYLRSECLRVLNGKSIAACV